MSNIKSKNTEFSKIEFNENKINILENKSKEKAKELIKTLLKNTLNASLLKLESNSNNHIESLSHYFFILIQLFFKKIKII